MVPKLTTNGISLMIRAMNGEGLEFSKISIGNGDAPEDFTVLTDIMNPIANIGISEIQKNDYYVILKGPMTNEEIGDGFSMTEIGVFATDPESGDEILYAYAHYKLSGDSKAIYIPPVTSNIVEITYSLYVFVGEIDNVTAILAESSQYASLAALKAHTEDSSNPHGVTKGDVGLDKVPNVAPENQQPNFSSAFLISTTADGKTTFPNIAPTERMSTILQKIRTAIYCLLTHISGDNPHKINPEGIGAAEEGHTHSATEIVRGTLGIPRGGTGGASSDEARKNLGIQSGWEQIETFKGQHTTVEIQFPSAMKTTPNVVLTPHMGTPESTDILLYIISCSETGFTVGAYTDSDLYNDNYVSFYWIAVE